MSFVQVERIFGRTPDESKVAKFFEWFSKDDSEISEERPDQVTFDYQGKTDSYILEVQTINQDRAKSIREKFEELGMEMRFIGDIQKL